MRVGLHLHKIVTAENEREMSEILNDEQQATHLSSRAGADGEAYILFGRASPEATDGNEENKSLCFGSGLSAK